MTTEVERPASLDIALVQEFVGSAHGDLERVKVRLEEEPRLVHATFDWGGGDWETGLGAAAHMGNRSIGLYLLERGARMDIFAAAMLGYLDVVMSILEFQPSAGAALGPHGIPLIAHANAGGAEALKVVEFLQAG
jgi:hypothetical protein